MKNNFDIKTRDLIVWKGWVVMSRTEEHFFKKMFQKLAYLRPTNVLEIGYGLGISAELIQGIFKPRHHDIVEIDETIFRDLKKFSKDYTNVKAIRSDFWTFKPSHKYDFIFFDPFDYMETYSNDNEENHYYVELGERMYELLSPKGVICWPQFGLCKMEKIPGFKLKIHKKLKVDQYLSHDGEFTDEATIACWEQN